MPPTGASALALMACSEGIILHRIARHDTADPRPLLRVVVRTPPSLIDSRAGMVTGSSRFRLRLDRGSIAIAGNDDAAHLRRLPSTAQSMVADDPRPDLASGKRPSRSRGRSAPSTPSFEPLEAVGRCAPDVHQQAEAVDGRTDVADELGVHSVVHLDGRWDSGDDSGDLRKLLRSGPTIPRAALGHRIVSRGPSIAVLKGYYTRSVLSLGS